MNRREFIKGAVLTAALVSSGKAFASYEGEESGGGPLLELKNRENPSVGEQKHVPGIEAPSRVKKGEWFDVKVKVGFMKEHPSTPEHWITSIKLLADGDPIANVTYPVGGAAASSATFRIKVEGNTRLQAIENCNLHGTWIGDPVTVSV